MKGIRLIYVLVLSLVFYGVASAIEATDELIVHDVNSVVHTDEGQEAPQHLDDGADHCTHCCHAHVSNLQAASSNLSLAPSTQRFLAVTRNIENLILGPPTPPPDA